VGTPYVLAMEGGSFRIWVLEKSKLIVPLSKGLDLQLVMVKIIDHGGGSMSEI